jgi:neutral ceramidase
MITIAPLLLAQLACDTAPEREDFQWPEVAYGAPMAGAAEGTLDLVIGGPMGGYSSRCGYLGSASKQDNRDSAYTVNWDESTGAQTRPGLKAVWLSNGDDHLVLIKADVIYSYDGLVEEISDQLSAATGLDLTGKVVLAANHSHASFSNFSDQLHFYLGGDKYNEEIFERFASMAVDMALTAYESLEPAAIGASWTKDWDPDDRVYRDRRGDNDELVVWDDQESPGWGKDPYVHTLRIDSADGEPIAALFTFGIHGTTLSDDSPMISSDAPGHVELAVQEQFDSPVVVIHLQGAGGDASPAGRDDGYARLETVGEYAGAALKAIWESTPTSTDPLRMETASRHIPQDLESIRVTRDGAVDWYYPPYDPDRVIDNVIYDESGDIISPLDEFNAPYGAAFCGSDDPLIPAGDIGATVFPYTTCMDVDLVSRVLIGIFGLTEDEIALPMNSSLKAGTTASRLGPLLTRGEDGSEVADDLLIGFFPAEPTAMFVEQWRRRVSAELGYHMPLLVGYSQDHQGYYLIPEDWLVGGYEPNINLWGPLEAEHVMEGVLEYSESVLGTDVREPEDPMGWWSPTNYLDRDLPTAQPDTTSDAGTLLESAPDYFWLPMEWTRDVEDGLEGHLVLETPAEVPRVQGHVQLAWYGGDPAVDFPRVSLQRQEGGEWVEVTTHAGRPITDTLPDIILAHTPDPLYPAETVQSHMWWAAWQAVDHHFDRMGLPEGTYRLAVSGQRYTGGDETWPWSTEPYEVTGDSFQVVPATISTAADEGGFWAWIQGPEDGWRLVDIEGESRGYNPLRGGVTVTWETTTGAITVQELSADELTLSGGRTWIPLSPPEPDATGTITDGYGNSGSIAL